MAKRYVYIVTRATSHPDGTETAEVMSHEPNAALAAIAAEEYPTGGYEGPVPVSMYPIGKVFCINERNKS